MLRALEKWLNWLVCRSANHRSFRLHPAAGYLDFLPPHIGKVISLKTISELITSGFFADFMYIFVAFDTNTDCIGTRRITSPGRFALSVLVEKPRCIRSGVFLLAYAVSNDQYPP